MATNASMRFIGPVIALLIGISLFFVDWGRSFDNLTTPSKQLVSCDVSVLNPIWVPFVKSGTPEIFASRCQATRTCFMGFTSKPFSIGSEVGLTDIIELEASSKDGSKGERIEVTEGQTGDFRITHCTSDTSVKLNLIQHNQIVATSTVQVS